MNGKWEAPENSTYVSTISVNKLKTEVTDDSQHLSWLDIEHALRKAGTINEDVCAITATHNGITIQFCK